MKTTETDSYYDNLDKMNLKDILISINNEDKKVPIEIEKIIPQVESLVNAVLVKLSKGGRLFYIGAGTSGRLGILDAAECPPTFGIENKIIGIIAGGERALTHAVENAEDDVDAGWNDLLKHTVSPDDFVIGISSSGATPYIAGALYKCNQHSIETGSITCNHDAPISKEAKYPVEVIVGPEFVTGSTRMKAGTAEKLILNMISTSLMIKLGRVRGNKMIDMQLVNSKLIERGIKIIQDSLNINYEGAKDLLIKCGSVRKSLESGK